MEFQIPIKIDTLPAPIHYRDKVMLIGSCFTEHIGNTLAEWKFPVLQNPNGILFDPVSIAGSLVSYIQNRQYNEDDLFYQNEVWQHWQYHSRYAHTDRQECVNRINASQQQAQQFLKEASWLIITPGTSFSYRLSDAVATTAGAGPEGSVANCHKAPAAWFHKHLLTIEEINSALDNCLHQLFFFNPNLKIIFTISPVRHIRDGIIDNNRSKARLLEVIHHLVNKFDKLFYFPAYELLIDVLRDYRFYDADMVHPNHQGARFVIEKFMQHCVDPSSQALAVEIQKLVTARQHKPFQPDTEAHQKFLRSQLEKAKALCEQYPFLNLDEEIEYFSRYQ